MAHTPFAPFVAPNPAIKESKMDPDFLAGLFDIFTSTTDIACTNEQASIGSDTTPECPCCDSSSESSSDSSSD